MTQGDPCDRYAPGIPFPAYAFVPGRHPHPVRDPQGHSFGKSEKAVAAPDENTLEQNPSLRFGVDLFNSGYYWEAHEVWEGLWHACGRRGRLADFLKALIHLAAAGVKAREGRPNGVQKHAARARELFQETSHPALIEIAERLASHPIIDTKPTAEGHPVLRIRLEMDMLTGNGITRQ